MRYERKGAAVGSFLLMRSALLACAILCMLGMLAIASLDPACAWAEERIGSINVHALQSNTDGIPAEDGQENHPSVLPSDSQPVSGAVFVLEKLSCDAAAANGKDPAVTVDAAPLASFGSRTGVTDDAGTCAFEGLGQGVYRLTVGEGTGLVPAQKSFLVAVPMRNADGSHQWAVHVYPKLRSVQPGKALEECLGSAEKGKASRGSLLATGDSMMVGAFAAILIGSAAVTAASVAMRRRRGESRAALCEEGSVGTEKTHG